jgi:hypothetical protein
MQSLPERHDGVCAFDPPVATTVRCRAKPRRRHPIEHTATAPARQSSDYSRRPPTTSTSVVGQLEVTAVEDSLLAVADREVR